MLKVDQIEFIDSQERNYKIFGYQIESFPLIGGTKANVITTHVWNQHGNTFIDSYMEAQDEELIFVLPLINKNRYDTLDLRREVTNICNPLNGSLTMKVTLNSGDIYNRDITFTTAPMFPTGRENRNSAWQKVQLQYTANNPFWYAENEITESFQAVEPRFFFPFTMSTTSPVIFGNILPNNIATNIGQVEAPVTIQIIGACTNPRIENVTTGEFLQFNNLTMGTNDVLEINTAFGQKKVLLNGANVFNKLDFDSTFFNLRIGDNEIAFSDDTGSNTAAIHFIYKNLYITI